ncbi:hypothetical protein AGR1C_Cc50234 [Agrobacterium fabacearum TT111]|nr:hypothetical protein AGR1C_Cc50234 [Agrobacterium fabacearum TT111]
MDIFSPITSGEIHKRLWQLRFLEVSTGLKKLTMEAGPDRQGIISGCMARKQKVPESQAIRDLLMKKREKNQSLAAESFASRASMRARNASFSSRALIAISRTASNSSRLTTSRLFSQRSACACKAASASLRIPCAAPAASVISLANSSRKRLVPVVLMALFLRRFRERSVPCC